MEVFILFLTLLFPGMPNIRIHYYLVNMLLMSLNILRDKEGMMWIN